VPRIVVRAESESDSNNEITIKVNAFLEPMRTCFCKQGDHPYLVIERALNKPDEWLNEEGNIDSDKVVPNANTCAMDIHLLPVVKTEHYDHETDPSFKEIKMKMQVLTGSDKTCLLKFSVRRADNDDKRPDKVYGYHLTNTELVIKQIE
jgi:hypothetical protein